MNKNDFLVKKKKILESFNKGKYEKVIKFATKVLKTNNDFQLFYWLRKIYLSHYISGF